MGEDKPLPLFSSADDAEALAKSADLTGYDLSALTLIRFYLSSKNAQVNMRPPTDLLAVVKVTTGRRGMSYQWFIRQALARAPCRKLERAS